MKLSNRDKKLLLILGILVVVLIPVFFIFKPFSEKAAALKEENIQLKARLDELDVLYQNKDAYIGAIAKMDENAQLIMEGFDEGLDQENIIMFIHHAEDDMPFVIEKMIFGEAVTTVLKAPSVDAEGNATQGLQFLSKQTTVEFNTTYQGLKNHLAYIRDNADRMNLSGVHVEYDEATGRLAGSFILTQYAFTGDGRVYEDAGIPALERGNDSIFGHFISDEFINILINGPEVEEEEETEDEELEEV